MARNNFDTVIKLTDSATIKITTMLIVLFITKVPN